MDAASASKYGGTELALFAGAIQWKRYALGRLAPFARGRVLEVGAGIGSSTPYLLSDAVTQWVCLEPDPGLAAQIRAGTIDRRVQVVEGTIATVAGGAHFDAIYYVDVLEHIEDDRAELKAAATLLSQDGRLVVLAPAHQGLFSEFDRAVGHFRRYNRSSLLAQAPPELVLEQAYYLDAAGLLASAANRFILGSSTPRPAQIAFWDRCLVPASRILDPLLAHRVGKTVIAVWRKPATR